MEEGNIEFNLKTRVLLQELQQKSEIKEAEILLMHLRKLRNERIYTDSQENIKLEMV